MTFEHWWRSKYPVGATKDAFDLMREAYAAGAAEEREACAKVCRDLEKTGTEPTGEICAMAIESRAYAL